MAQVTNKEIIRRLHLMQNNKWCSVTISRQINGLGISGSTFTYSRNKKSTAQMSLSDICNYYDMCYKFYAGFPISRMILQTHILSTSHNAHYSFFMSLMEELRLGTIDRSVSPTTLTILK